MSQLFLLLRSFVLKVLLFLFPLLGFLLLPLNKTEAGIQIPSGLSSSDRQKALGVLGLGTSSKILADPYPLGGYSGFEFGLAFESVATDDLSRLGTKVDPQSRFNYPKISVGKGLYNNLDVFVHFIPMIENIGMSEYGALVRWGFFQGAYFPATVSLLFHGNVTNVNNIFTSQSLGADLVAGVSTNSFSIYFGAGQTMANGRFIGNHAPLCDTTSGNTCIYDESMQVLHLLIGSVFHLGQFFGAVQIDQYTEPVYGVKVGAFY